MRYLLILLFSLATGTFTFSQQKEFLNLSICPPPEISPLEETIEYMQGGGHNYYLSYTPEDHLGSYSEEFFPYGTESNPLIIYVDSVSEGVVEKYYITDPGYEMVTGLDPTEPFVDSGVWTDTYPDREIPVEILGYDAIGPYVFQCVLKEEEK